MHERGRSSAQRLRRATGTSRGAPRVARDPPVDCIGRAMSVRPERAAIHAKYPRPARFGRPALSFGWSNGTKRPHHYGSQAASPTPSSPASPTPTTAPMTTSLR
jgi:hypothetical protein